eukprot:459076-Rhodomonas_salina.2
MAQEMLTGSPGLLAQRNKDDGQGYIVRKVFSRESLPVTSRWVTSRLCARSRHGESARVTSVLLPLSLSVSTSKHPENEGRAGKWERAVRNREEEREWEGGSEEE